MKIRSKATLLFLLFAVQPNGLAYAQDENILDLIPWAAFSSDYSVVKKNLKLCKVTYWVPLDCGNGSGGWVDNFYVIYIEKNETPAKGSPYFTLEDNQQPKAKIPKEFCAADSIEYTRVLLDDLPQDMQNDVKADPRSKSKQAVYHRIRVHNGSGKDTIRIYQQCEK